MLVYIVWRILGKGASDDIMKANSREINELFVITKAKELATYILTVTDKAPKKFRFTLVSRMQNLSLNIIEYLLRANDVYIGGNNQKRNIAIRNEWQQRAITDLKILNYIGMVAMEQNCILHRQYKQIAQISSEVMALAIRWKRGNKD